MANAVVELGLRLGEGRLALSGKTVGRWERGESHPRAPYPKLLCNLLESSAEELGLRGENRNGAASLPHSPLDPRSSPGTIVGALGSRLVAASAQPPAQLLPAQPPEVAQKGVDSEAIDLLASALRALRRLDDRLGSLVVVKPALELRGTVDFLFRAPLNPATRDRLLALTAETSQFLGWLAYDAGDHNTARAYYQDGLRPAGESDQDLTLSLLGHIAQLALANGKTAEALGVIDQASQQMSKPVSHLTRSLFAAIEAELLAVVGEDSPCRLALDRARTEFERAQSEDSPACLYFFDEAELTAYEGECFERIGHPALAGERWSRALDLLGDERVRDRARFLVHRANTLAHEGDLERACGAAGEALGIAVEVGSIRIRRNVEKLRSQWETWREVPSVRELDQQLALVN